MEVPAMRTSFDEVCAASLQRHYTVCGMILGALKKIRPQSDQNEWELRSLSEEVTTKMEEFLLDETKDSDKPLSAEFFAERWDYMLWCIYKAKCNVDEEFPFEFPQHNETYAQPPAPEHLRILEPQKVKAPAAHSVAGPSRIPAPALSAPQAKGDAKSQDTVASMVKGFEKLEVGQPQAAYSGFDPVSTKVLSEGFEWDLTRSFPGEDSIFGLSKLSPFSTPSPREQRSGFDLPKPSPPPSPTRLSPPSASMSNDQLRGRFTSAVLTSDENTRLWQKRADDRVESAAKEAGMSKNDYVSALEAPLNETYTRRSAKEEPVSKPVSKPFSKPVSKPKLTWADEGGDDKLDAPSPTKSTKSPKSLLKIKKNYSYILKTKSLVFSQG